MAVAGYTTNPPARICLFSTFQRQQQHGGARYRTNPPRPTVALYPARPAAEHHGGSRVQNKPGRPEFASPGPGQRQNTTAGAMYRTNPTGPAHSFPQPHPIRTAAQHGGSQEQNKPRCRTNRPPAIAPSPIWQPQGQNCGARRRTNPPTRNCPELHSAATMTTLRSQAQNKPSRPTVSPSSTRAPRREPGTEQTRPPTV